MKIIDFLLILTGSLLANAPGSFAQKDSSGIYKTAGDFKNRKLSYAINYRTEKHKINSYVLFNDDVIKVKHQGTAYTLKKSETYGYRNTKGVEFRFVDNKEYKILNPGEAVLLYVYQHPAHSPKEAGKNEPMNYFTINAVDPPKNLTKANLKAAFPENHKLHDALDAQFRNDAELTDYDRFHRMYKLSWGIKNNSK